MTLRHLRIFVTVCEFGSVTIAAEKLYIAQPSVSLAISELENNYGVKFFDRISRRLYLTEAGRHLLEYASHIVTLFDEMEQNVKNWDSLGIIRIGSSITIGTCLMPGWVSEFSQEHKSVRLKLTLDNSEQIMKKVLSNELDFAFIEGIPHDKQLVSEKLMEDELVVVCSVQDTLNYQEKVTLNDLAAKNFILREPGSGTRELFNSVMLTHNISVEPQWVSTNTQAIVKAVSQGLGISVLPLRLVEDDLNKGVIRRLEVDQLKFLRNFYVVHHKNKYLPGFARDFISFCMKSGEPKIEQEP